MRLLPLLSLCALTATSQAKLTWGNTKYLFVFGDSYTTTGFNVSAGVNSTDPGWVSSNGPNWVQTLRDTYNVAGTKVFNLAFGGATIDSKLVTPYQPTVLSVVDQVAQFKAMLSSKPPGATWDSSNALFAVWIGINDVGNAWSWTNTTQSAFNKVLMNRLATQIDELYSFGARSFLFLTVPPINRAPLFVAQNQAASTSLLAQDIANYNVQLRTTAQSFVGSRKYPGFEATVFDTQPVFNTLLDEASVFKFANTTGYCDAYQNGTPNISTQIAPCGPVSTYFWLNSLHPVFTLHSMLAHAIAAVIS
ncbi:SGNH-hydro domain-containing protein [Mycena indigotica]|uniref:SGNH-hydro domain-containing protein n=1 Tax=Mycena indigotica TaxID=2126181 RepID=A0A8H6VVP1_9AGAR|nr:SGNH-hydro domain-containing protein [Mycena indigotica]KAF7295694.1 SGNH-hydro domain-containing protein [Mycena indigotica]